MRGSISKKFSIAFLFQFFFSSLVWGTTNQHVFDSLNSICGDKYINQIFNLRKNKYSHSELDELISAIANLKNNWSKLNLKETNNILRKMQNVLFNISFNHGETMQTYMDASDKIYKALHILNEIKF